MRFDSCVAMRAAGVTRQDHEHLRYGHERAGTGTNGDGGTLVIRAVHALPFVPVHSRWCPYRGSWFSALEGVFQDGSPRRQCLLELRVTLTDTFCAHCGQERTAPISGKASRARRLGEVSALDAPDSDAARSHLLPGHTCREWLAGRRKPYITP